MGSLWWVAHKVSIGGVCWRPNLGKDDAIRQRGCGEGGPLRARDVVANFSASALDAVNSRPLWAGAEFIEYGAVGIARLFTPKFAKFVMN